MIDEKNDEPVTIKVPAFGDDPFIGRYIHPVRLLSPIIGGSGTITIQHNVLTYKVSRIDSSPPKTFNLTNIIKLFEVRTKYSFLKKDFGLDLQAFNAQYYLELFLVGDNKDKHILIPSFAETIGVKKRWEKFLDDLKKRTCLPLERIEMTAEKSR